MCGIEISWRYNCDHPMLPNNDGLYPRITIFQACPAGRSRGWPCKVVEVVEKPRPWSCVNCHWDGIAALENTAQSFRRIASALLDCSTESIQTGPSRYTDEETVLTIGLCDVHSRTINAGMRSYIDQLDSAREAALRDGLLYGEMSVDYFKNPMLGSSDKVIRIVVNRKATVFEFQETSSSATDPLHMWRMVNRITELYLTDDGEDQEEHAPNQSSDPSASEDIIEIHWQLSDFQTMMEELEEGEIAEEDEMFRRLDFGDCRMTA